MSSPYNILMKKTVEQRFWEKVGPHDDPNVCWLWIGCSSQRKQGGHGNQRYGHIRVDGATFQVHRFSYVLHYGTIPEGMTIDHVKARGCTSTLCVNPAHLEAVTNKVNILRGDSFSAVEAKQTHCVHGHSFDEENTLYSGQRFCRACNKEKHIKMRKKVKV